MEFHIIEHPVFTNVMSRHGKNLREDVFKFCLTYGVPSQLSVDIQAFSNAIITNYNPVVWERAVLYAHPSEIFNAVERATSTTGNIKGGRKKDVNWLGIATKFDYDLWLPKVKERRLSGIDPHDFNKLIGPFTVIYTSITNWLLSDFGFNTLMQIFDICRRYSVSIVNECVDIIDNPQNKSVDYLLAVIDKELAIRRAQMMEDRELSKQSEQVINTIVTIATNRSIPVDWDAIDKVVDVDAANKSEFDKVK